MSGYTLGGSTGALYGTSDGGLYAQSEPIQSGLVQFRAIRQGSGTLDSDLFDVDPVRDSFGIFASSATLRFIDSDGTKDGDYPYGQRVEVEVTSDGGSTWTRRFAGVVNDATRTTKGGLPQLEVQLVGYDHLLRRRKIYKDYSSTTRSSILNDLITNFTSVTWNASNVTVVNDESVDLPLRGRRVDEAVRQIANESANEEWGVNRDLEFFFREQDITRARRITDGDVEEYDLPREGKRAINRYQLFYGSNGSNFVEVEDRDAQRELKNKLNAPRRVVISDSDTLTEVSTEARAEKIARGRLGDRSVIQTGTVTVPLGRFDTDSGDVIKVTISDADISNTDFRVAQIDYNWQRGTTELTIAENAATNINSLLRSLSDSVSNVRARDADTSATGTRYLEQQAGVTMSIDATVLTKTYDGGFLLGQSDWGDDLGSAIASRASVTVESSAVTAPLLNMARDVWQGESATDLTHMGVGTDDTEATRADTSLQAETNRNEISKFSAGSATDKLELIGVIPPGGAIASAGDAAEAMFFDAASGGSGYLRLTFGDTSIDNSTTLIVAVTVTINDDGDADGVITNTGQERLRDLLVGETGHAPSDLVYGTDSTDPSVTDTSLGSQVHEDAIDSTADKQTGLTDVIERIGSSEANSNDIAEIGKENSSDELLARLVIESLTKTNSFALETNYRFRARNA